MRSISIHVPREGHDHRHQYRGGETLKFQSTCPARGTTHRTETLDRRDLFQSTCPARGTTNINILLIKQAGYFNPRAPRGARPGDATVDGSDTGISIHVPREGHDAADTGAAGHQRISIHVPREGHDIAMNLLKEMIFNISIHVPREGHDSLQLGSRMMPSYFNPRAPRGARPPKTQERQLQNLSFQSTCPARGTTNAHGYCGFYGAYFNPRAPRGARLYPAVANVDHVTISIHVPREGHDLENLTCQQNGGAFQSTCPARGTTSI